MAGTITFPIKMLVNVTTDYNPKMLNKDNFNRLCIVGSGVNTRGTPSGIYTSLEGVAGHYAADTNEYKIASLLFTQIPRPESVRIASVADIVYPPAE